MKICVRPNVLNVADQQKLIQAFPSVDFAFKLEEDAEVLIGYPNIVQKKVLNPLGNVRWIQLFSDGYDHIDHQYLTEHNITLTNAHNIYSIPIAEDILARLLSINRGLINYVRDQDQRQWHPMANAKELYGATIGYLGAGSIAQESAKRLAGFNVHLIAYRAHSGAVAPFNEIYTGEDGLKTLLKQSDYVIITLPSNSATHQLMNKKHLEMMKSDAVLVNIGRGDIIVEKDLIDVLNSGRLRAVSLDVFENEPLVATSPLYHFPNIQITPHNAGSSEYKSERLLNLLLTNISHYLKHEPLINIVKI